MGITRRDLIALTGGAVTGTLLSPVPWKLLDDTAIWTQNWSWTPRPPTGPVSTRFATCTLCGAGCGLQARSAGKSVFGVAPVPLHPVSAGALCPAVFGAHQLPYHQRRLREALVQGKPSTVAEAIRAIAAAIKARTPDRPIALLDERPRRMISAAYHQWTHALDGCAVTLTQSEDATLAAVESLASLPHGSLGFDFEHAGVILSLGAPLLDGWGVPGRLPRVWSNRDVSGSPIFVHAGPRLSHSALLSDQRFLIRPGSEAAFAAGLAGVLVRSGATAHPNSRFAREAAAFSVDQTAHHTGAPAPEIERLAHFLASHRPAIVIGGGEPGDHGLDPAAESIIAGLNALLGSIGTPGGTVARRPAPGIAIPPPVRMDVIHDHSLAVLIHDASTPGVVVPEDLLRRKLAPGGILVRLTPYQPEPGSLPDIAIPATAFLEAQDDSAGPPDATLATWSLAPALLEPPPGVLSPAAFLTQLAAELGFEAADPSALMKQKSAAIFSSRRGKLFDSATKSMTSVATIPEAEALWKALSEGATWIDDSPAKSSAPRIDLDQIAIRLPEPVTNPLTLIAAAWKGSAGVAPACPLATKVERETRLRPIAGEARLNPSTAAQLGFHNGDGVVVAAGSSELDARLRLEPVVPPGLVEMAAAGPQRQTILQLAGSAVRLRKVHA